MSDFGTWVTAVGVGHIGQCIRAVLTNQCKLDASSIPCMGL